MHCDLCPRPPGQPCPGETSPHPCQTTDPASPRYWPEFRAWLAGEGPPAVRRGPSAAAMLAAAAVPESPPPGPDPVSVLACIKAAKACARRTLTDSCSYALCSAGRGGMGGKVTLGECLECYRTASPWPPPPAGDTPGAG